MNNFFLYGLESSFYLTFLYAFYMVFLRRDKLLRRNRLYLLLSYLCALSLPPIDITIFDPMHDLKIETQVFSNIFYPYENVATVTSAAQPSSYLQLSSLLYFIIAGLLFIMLLTRFTRLFRIINKGHKQLYGDFILVTSDEILEPFSFFKFIFINPDLYDHEQWEAVLSHETGHIKFKHSLDILLAELMKIVLWFNPVSWIMRRSLAEVHEYQADTYVLSRGFSRKLYQNTLFKISTFKDNFMLVHPFHGDVLKRRILMMRKQVDKPIRHIKLTGIIPVIVILLAINFIGTKNNSLILPITKGKITSGYGIRLHPVSKRMIHHNGIDIGAPRGTPITAVADGIVIRTGEEKGPGKYILLQHAAGWHSYYSQLENIIVNRDQNVVQGEHIGNVGSSGISTAPHLHFELHLNTEPVDPERYLNFNDLN